MKRTPLKALVSVLCATLTFASGLILTGCSKPDPEKIIRADLILGFDQIINPDDEAIDELAKEYGDTGLEELGIEPSEFIASVADGFDYSIESIEVDGDTATANVTIYSKSLSELSDLNYDEMYEDFIRALESGEVTFDEKSFKAWAGPYIMDAIDRIEPSEKSLEIIYVNGDDGWELDAESNDALTQLFI